MITTHGVKQESEQKILLPEEKIEKQKISPPNEKMMVTVEKEEFTCPISLQIFWDPMMITPCGHLFENDALLTWRKTHIMCPCCRQTIDGISPATPFFKEKFSQFLHNNPSFNEDHYFNLSSFYSCLRDEKVSQEKLHSLLKISETNLNAIGPQGFTAVFLLAETSKGRELLRMHPELRKKIQPEGFNAIIQEGEEKGCSAVAWLTANHEGLRLLLIDAELCEKITPEGLNTIEQNGPHRGSSAVTWLTGSEIGREFLIKHPSLCEKIMPEGLNTIRQGGKDQGCSAVYWLTANLEGRELLIKHPDLCEKIRPEALNAIKQDGKDQGCSAVYWLMGADTGRRLLLQNARLRSLITKKALNTIVEEGEEKGKSPAYWLLNTDSGQELLKIDPKLKEKIDPQEQKKDSSLSKLFSHSQSKKSEDTHHSDFSKKKDKS